MRVAIYHTPPYEHPLTRAAADWLGRCAFTGAPKVASVAPDLTASARRYGFHATIRAPFRPIEGCDLGELEDRLAQFCGTAEPIAFERLALAELGSFRRSRRIAPNRSQMRWHGFNATFSNSPNLFARL